MIYAISTPNKSDLFAKVSFLEKFFINFNLLEIQFLFVAIFFLYVIFLNFIISLNFIITEKLVRNLYNSLFSRLVDQYFVFNPKSFSKFEVSEKINTLSYDLQYSAVYIFRSVFRNFSKIYSLFFIFIVMFVIDFGKSIIFLIFFIFVYFLIFKKLGKNLKFMGEKSSQKNLEINKNIKDVFNNLKTIHIDDLFLKVGPKLMEDGNIWIKSQEKLQIDTFLLKIYAEVLAMISILCLILFMLFTSQQEIIFATIGFYVYAFYRAFPNMQSIFSAFVIFKGWSKVLDKVVEKLNQNVDKIELEDKPIFFNDEIKINNLSYKFEDDTDYLIRNLNIKIKKKSIFGIKGESGSGKTTLLDILSGIKFPSSGEILIDNDRLKPENLLTWYKMISYVPQKIFLFNDTIKNNIIVNNKNISNNELSIILKTVGLEILEDLKNDLNLDKIVNELNNNLSGGEIQRLSIARALIKKPKLLILDETTSGIQIEMEKKNINKYKKFFSRYFYYFNFSQR